VEATRWADVGREKLGGGVIRRLCGGGCREWEWVVGWEGEVRRPPTSKKEGERGAEGVRVVCWAEGGAKGGGVDLDTCCGGGRVGRSTSPRRPPTSKNEGERGARGKWCGEGSGLVRGLGDFGSVSADSAEERMGKFHSLTGAGVRFLAWEERGRAMGAGRGRLGSSDGSGVQRMPRSLTRSASLPQLRAVMVLRGVVPRSRLLFPPVLPKRKRCFFAPRSRTKEPRTRALETAAAARISREARRERNCWSECRSVTPMTR